jgi:hypothetical protein
VPGETTEAVTLMKVSDVMTPECDVCRGTDTIATVAKLMALKDIGSPRVAGSSGP